jgi:siroheme synthase-like protein
MLDVSGKLAVIVGGGRVGARKARGLIEAGVKRVRIVSLDFDPSIPAEAERIEEMYEAHHLDGADLVFAATNQPAVNAAVTRDAEARKILVCRSDHDDRLPGDFTTPAHHRENALLIAVTAGSAALSAAVRDEIVARLDPRWGKLAETMQTVRPLVLGRFGHDPVRRAEVLRKLAEPDALDHCNNDAELIAWLATRYPEFAHA